MKNQKYILKIKDFFEIKNFCFLLCIFTFCFLIFNIAALAAVETTPSGEEKAKQILEAVRERIQEKQGTTKQKAYVGILKSIANSTLVLETKNGIRQVKVSSEAAILRITEKTKKEIEFEDLAISEFTIAMGYPDENEVLEATRLLVSKNQKKEQERDAVFGLVEEVDLKNNIIKIKAFKKEKTWDIKTTNKTEISKKVEGKIEEVALKEIEPGQHLITTGVLEEEENTLTSHRIYIRP